MLHLEIFKIAQSHSLVEIILCITRLVGDTSSDLTALCGGSPDLYVIPPPLCAGVTRFANALNSTFFIIAKVLCMYRPSCYYRNVL